MPRTAFTAQSLRAKVGGNSQQKIGPIEESIRCHRPLESRISNGEITITTCGTFPVR